MRNNVRRGILITVIMLSMVCFVVTSCGRAESDSNASSENADRIPVITYHRICTDSYHNTLTDQVSLWHKLSSFEEEMKYLHDNGYTTLSMDEFYEWYKGERNVPSKSVVITFDDGHYSVIKYGLPVLRKYNMKATVFLIGKDYNFKADSKNPMACIGLEDIYKTRQDYPELDFQSHTYKLHNNSNVDPVVPDMSYEEIVRDFELQDMLFKALDFEYLAYPYGIYTEDFIKAAKDSGYKLAFLYGNADYARRTDDAMEIPRIGIRGDQTLEQAFYRWFEE